MAAEWYFSEREVCDFFGLRHVGGPGQPDCAGVGAVIDTKDYTVPVDRSVVRKVAETSWFLLEEREVIVYSLSGFTDGAYDEAEYYGIWLAEPDGGGRVLFTDPY